MLAVWLIPVHPKRGPTYFLSIIISRIEVWLPHHMPNVLGYAILLRHSNAEYKF
jgi:hypothetical protein